MDTEHACPKCGVVHAGGDGAPAVEPAPIFLHRFALKRLVPDYQRLSYGDQLKVRYLVQKRLASLTDGTLHFLRLVCGMLLLALFWWQQDIALAWERAFDSVRSDLIEVHDAYAQIGDEGSLGLRNDPTWRPEGWAFSESDSFLGPSDYLSIPFLLLLMWVCTPDNYRRIRIRLYRDAVAEVKAGQRGVVTLKEGE